MKVTNFRDPHLYPSCSFCGKANNEVKMLIAGPSSQICDECVALATDILHEKHILIVTPVAREAKLARALGLTEGCLRIKEMAEFNKDGLVKNLEEVREILIKEVENDE